MFTWLDLRAGDPRSKDRGRWQRHPWHRASSSRERDWRWAFWLSALGAARAGESLWKIQKMLGWNIWRKIRRKSNKIRLWALGQGKLGGDCAILRTYVFMMRSEVHLQYSWFPNRHINRMCNSTRQCFTWFPLFSTVFSAAFAGVSSLPVPALWYMCLLI